MEKQELKISIPPTKDGKEWENSIIACMNYSNKDSHPIFIESRNFFPYYFVLDENKSNIAFINREYEFLPQRISVNMDCDVKWYKINITDDLKKTFPESTKVDFRINGKNYYGHEFYIDRTAPYSHELDLINYLRKISYIDLHLVNHSPFINKLLLTLSQSYTLLFENIRLRNENSRLEELKDSLMKTIQRNQKVIERLQKIINK